MQPDLFGYTPPPVSQEAMSTAAAAPGLGLFLPQLPVHKGTHLAVKVLLTLCSVSPGCSKEAARRSFRVKPKPTGI